MTNKRCSTNPGAVLLGLRHLAFLRHSSFGIRHLDGQQSFCDAIDSFARPATCWNDLDVRLQNVNVVCQRFDAHAHSIRQVDLVDDHDLCPEEHVRMFAHHPRPFCHAHHHDTRFGTEREFGRTNQVPDVLNENEFGFADVDLAQTFSDQVCVEVAAVNRGDLHDRHPKFFNLISVLASRCVAIENGYTTQAS